MNALTLTLKDIARMIRKHHPRDADSLLESCGFTIRFLGDGAFRRVYEIIGSGYVIKVPIITESDIGVEHARREYRTWRKAMRSTRKYFEVKAYLPDIPYFHDLTGVTIMPVYGALKFSKELDREMDRVAEKLANITGNWDTDVASEKWDNWGVDKEGHLRMIDLGCLEEGC